MFSAFMTATGTMNKITTNAKMDRIVSESIQVKVDPVFGNKFWFDGRGEKTSGQTTVIEGNVDASHRNWELVYQNTTYQVADIKAVPGIGSNDPQHFELVLR
jgi:hypothetical protein